MPTDGRVPRPALPREFPGSRLLRHGIRRQLAFYLLIGIGQLVVDWLCFVLLTAWAMPVAPANVIARVCAAVLGFTANGTMTFKSRLRPAQLARFVTAWIPLTLANTLAVWALEAFGGLHLAWLIKPLVDALTAAAGFVVARHWIFRTHPKEPEAALAAGSLQRGPVSDQAAAGTAADEVDVR
ncbi:MAG: GtrA family protein [Xanthomonadaceae bacterium]|nr:GtrA family protein [Xanthomonadaceae bacterium]